MAGYNLNPVERISGREGEVGNLKKIYVVSIKFHPPEIMDNILYFMKIVHISNKILITSVFQSVISTDNIIIVSVTFGVVDFLTIGKRNI